MKKKYVYILVLYLISTWGVHAQEQQTGVQTRNVEENKVFQIDGKQDNNTTPGAAQLKNDFFITKEGEVGVGVPQPSVKVDVRSGEDKGIIGLGSTNQSAQDVGPGAIKYNSNENLLEYSDGVAWHAIPKALPPKATVLAYKSSSQSISQNNNNQYITGWRVEEDVHNNFNTTNGIFTAPRDGFYIVSVNITLSSATIPNNSRVETIIEGGTNTENINKFISMNTYPAFETGSVSNSIGGNNAAVFNLKAGDQIRVRIWHNLGGNRSIDTSNNGTNNSISIYEL